MHRRTFFSALGMAVAVASLGALQADGAATLTLVSRSTAGALGNSSSLNPALSGDGRFVAFESIATNLLPAGKDTNGVADIYLHDRQTQKTTRVSINSAEVQQNQAIDPVQTQVPAISDDGRFVAFSSRATNLVGGDTNTCGEPEAGPCEDVFLRDRQNGTTSRISKSSAGVEGNDESYNPVLSGDGRIVAFSSIANNLVGNDDGDFADAFVRDRSTGKTILISRSTAGEQGNDDSGASSISTDGRFVAFSSVADNLLGPGKDTNGMQDIFIRDLVNNRTTLVSRASGAGDAGNAESFGATISGDGRYVSFTSYATNLIGNDVNNYRDIFVRDRSMKKTTRVSLSSDEVPTNEHSAVSTISDDGRFVIFESGATNLSADDTDGKVDVFVRDRVNGTTERVSRTGSGGYPDAPSSVATISGDGRVKAWYSNAKNMFTQGEPDLFFPNASEVYVRAPGS